MAGLWSIRMMVSDTDDADAAIQVYSGSHLSGEYAHHANDSPHYALENSPQFHSTSVPTITSKSIGCTLSGNFT